MNKTGRNAHNLRRNNGQTGQKLGDAEVAEGVAAFESRDVQGHGVTLLWDGKSVAPEPLTGADRQRGYFSRGNPDFSRGQKPLG
jgi:hypothetical protein